MSILKVKGNDSGTGTVTLEAPNTNTDRSISIPDVAGTFATVDSRDILSAQFRSNAQTLSTSTTIAATENACCTGPLAVASGVTLTVAAGGNLSIV